MVVFSMDIEIPNPNTNLTCVPICMLSVLLCYPFFRGKKLINALPHLYTAPSITWFHQRTSDCSCLSVMASIKVNFCLRLVELTYMRFKNFHMQRFACFPKTYPEHMQNNAYISFTFLKQTVINLKSSKFPLSELKNEVNIRENCAFEKT
jgi:hypothetical protein